MHERIVPVALHDHLLIPQLLRYVLLHVHKKRSMHREREGGRGRKQIQHVNEEKTANKGQVTETKNSEQNKKNTHRSKAEQTSNKTRHSERTTRRNSSQSSTHMNTTGEVTHTHTGEPRTVATNQATKAQAKHQLKPLSPRFSAPSPPHRTKREMEVNKFRRQQNQP